MFLDEVVQVLEAMIECRKRMIDSNSHCSFPECDDCSLCYEQGTIGMQLESLKEAVSIINQEYF